MKNITTNKGFTLIELLVVISIIGLLSSVVLASLETAREKARNSQTIQNIDAYRTAAELYRNDNGSYPSHNPMMTGFDKWSCLGDGYTNGECDTGLVWGSDCISGDSIDECGTGAFRFNYKENEQVNDQFRKYMTSVPKFETPIEVESSTYWTGVIYKCGLSLIDSPVPCKNYIMIFMLEGKNQSCGRARILPGVHPDYTRPYTLCYYNTYYDL
ncbi:MAG: prepilin-type N-terminal cleavage/methylation domain-containing protein [Candidatus Paceibacteria bacterium]|jgi:prepilin-type N-terminal cleavage/methylation domain-containing protein